MVVQTKLNFLINAYFSIYYFHKFNMILHKNQLDRIMGFNGLKLLRINDLAVMQSKAKELF